MNNNGNKNLTPYEYLKQKLKNFYTLPTYNNQFYTNCSINLVRKDKDKLIERLFGNEEEQSRVILNKSMVSGTNKFSKEIDFRYLYDNDKRTQSFLLPFDVIYRPCALGSIQAHRLVACNRLIGLHLFHILGLLNSTRSVNDPLKYRFAIHLHLGSKAIDNSYCHITISVGTMVGNTGKLSMLHKLHLHIIGNSGFKDIMDYVYNTTSLVVKCVVHRVMNQKSYINLKKYPKKEPLKKGKFSDHLKMIKEEFLEQDKKNNNNKKKLKPKKQKLINSNETITVESIINLNNNEHKSEDYEQKYGDNENPQQTTEATKERKNDNPIIDNTKLISVNNNEHKSGSNDQKYRKSKKQQQNNKVNKKRKKKRKKKNNKNNSLATKLQSMYYGVSSRTCIGGGIGISMMILISLLIYYLYDHSYNNQDDMNHPDDLKIKGNLDINELGDIQYSDIDIIHHMNMEDLSNKGIVNINNLVSLHFEYMKSLTYYSFKNHAISITPIIIDVKNDYLPRSVTLLCSHLNWLPDKHVSKTIKTDRSIILANFNISSVFQIFDTVYCQMNLILDSISVNHYMLNSYYSMVQDYSFKFINISIRGTEDSQIQYNKTPDHLKSYINMLMEYVKKYCPQYFLTNKKHPNKVCYHFTSKRKGSIKKLKYFQMRCVLFRRSDQGYVPIKNHTYFIDQSIFFTTTVHANLILGYKRNGKRVMNKYSCDFIETSGAGGDKGDQAKNTLPNKLSL